MGPLAEADLGVAGRINYPALELGGSLGIAILDSILATTYRDKLAPVLDRDCLVRTTGIWTPGDVVRFVNSPRSLEDNNGWTDWNVDWSEWNKGSALSSAAS